MGIWKAYESIIGKNCLGNAEQLHGLPYWRNRLFATIMLYFIPFCILALIPGEIMSIVSRLYVLAVFDMTIVVAIALTGLLPNISIRHRKIILIALLYVLAIVLIYYIGWFGPGLMYLLAIVVFCQLIFREKYSLWPVGFNTFICAVITLALYFKPINMGAGLQYAIGSWIAVAANVIILSAVVAFLLPMLFNGLQHSNTRFEIVAKATSDTIWDWDILNDNIQYNMGMQQMFGYPSSAVENIKHWWANKIHPDDLDTVNNELASAFETGDSHLQLGYRFLCADGEYKHIFDRAFIVRNVAKKPVRMIGAMQDITRQKQEEQWLKLTELALRYATDAVVIVEADMNAKGQRKIVYVNEAFSQITGYQQKEVTGLYTDILWGIANKHPHKNELHNTFEQNGPFDIELINYKKNEEPYWSSKSISPVKDSTGNTTHWISIERDVTQLKNYVSAIEKQNTQLKEIAWTQAHVVRTPVARIMALVNLLNDEQNKPEDNAELIKLISASTHELDHVIRDIIKKSE